LSQTEEQMSESNLVINRKINCVKKYQWPKGLNCVTKIQKGRKNITFMKIKEMGKICIKQGSNDS